jgi:hypothetical protein
VADPRTPYLTRTVIRGPGFVIPWSLPDERQERRRWRRAGVVPEEVTA